MAVKNCHFPVVEALLDDWEKKNSDPKEKKKLANQKNMVGGVNGCVYAKLLSLFVFVVVDATLMHGDVGRRRARTRYTTRPP